MTPEMDVRGNESHVVASIFFEYVIKYFIASIPRKVNIDVRVVGSFWIQKPLKVEIVTYGVHFSYVKSSAHEAVGGRASADARDASLLCLTHDIPHNQKIGSKI